jgi:hypothetical protein
LPSKEPMRMSSWAGVPMVPCCSDYIFNCQTIQSCKVAAHLGACFMHAAKTMTHRLELTDRSFTLCRMAHSTGSAALHGRAAWQRRRHWFTSEPHPLLLQALPLEIGMPQPGIPPLLESVQTQNDSPANCFA